MKKFCFYNRETGAFNFRRFACDLSGARLIDAVARNCPEGHEAIEGDFDPLSQRIDVANGEIIDWQPPSPGDDHVWDPKSRRWAVAPAVQERRNQRAAAQATIDDIERKQLRVLRELALGQSGSLERLRKLDSDIQALRPLVEEKKT